ncbi:U11/U12 small nuclear ribonucleoprotein 59 kDa protein [Carica papaya]|uniref:U11/U12 small nuclear ribonucleoprotein 59 kDa protein n=1 Tax=Carica papaya TaxID=3649 RepID=UPI000B8D0C4A|nr:U11/U12 small nuclear ribonucleoprotein 59 kDa protein [Carica papaya]XP_021906302.1 U11/U12 small nuclear ribonucleoprotein 59 kDa protein [Carica papaya]XP_021906303.1 U11/U12 small nuclear ribonucleoprotein 59 kDa protein [Carica papaya]
MNPVPSHLPLLLPWFPMLPPDPPRSRAFWDTTNTRNQLVQLQDTLSLAKAMQKELEALMIIKDAKGSLEDIENDPSVSGVLKYLENRNMSLESQDSFSLEAANSLLCKLRAQLESFRYIVDERSPWEEKSAVVKLGNKMHKSKRNKLWRKRKRKRVAEMLAKEHECFNQADQEADEWRAREIAKDIANRKVEKMKEIAKVKAKEERKRLESELELVLIVEKLHELRSLRIQKLKKQGHFLPEEDDKFLERVRVAVEEEERQALAAADTDAAKDAIATAEESRKTIQNQGVVSRDLTIENDGVKEPEDKIAKTEETDAITVKESEKKGFEGQSFTRAYDSVANLPIEFYHYYHGSNHDMGTLIEVRRTWDAYIRPGGSRIPGHWVQPPPPADEIWASYLVRPKE